VEVESLDGLTETYNFVINSEDAKKYHWICIDSLSELAEVVLLSEKKNSKDSRAAYMTMADKMNRVIRTFRDLPGKHVYMSAKSERVKDDSTGAMLYGPSMPGQKLASALPFFFDEVFGIRNEKGGDGEIQTWLQTKNDLQYLAKDRSGALKVFERPHLGDIAKKILQKTEAAKTTNKEKNNA
jgi:hypothetical protein